jgi:predicted signal transduction protein with EAL and GGDEF domain
MNHDGRELDIAVNFSAQQLDVRAVATVKHALESSGLRPGRLILEVGETALTRDNETSATTYEDLVELGVRIAIDNFGTGYSSLLHLRHYPISALKIDHTFVAGIGESADDEAICASIVSLAGAVGASAIGQGVETEAQCAVLRSLGCHQGQGFLWSPAVPIDELDSALRACDEVPVAAPRSRTSRSPQGVPYAIRATMADMHAAGASTHTIAAALNRTVGRHPQGMRWTASVVARELPAAQGVLMGSASVPPSRAP